MILKNVQNQKNREILFTKNNSLKKKRAWLLSSSFLLQGQGI